MASRELDFDEFYRARAPGLLHSLQLAFGERSRAEDVVQEAFIRCWQKWAKLDADPIAWTRKVAWRLYIDDWRKSSRRLLRESAIAREPAPDSDLHEDCLELLRPLAPEQRAVMVLHYLEDLPIMEVANVLDISLGTVKSRLSRAREQLRRTDARSDHELR